MFTVFGKTFSASQMRVREVKKAKTEQSKDSKGSNQYAVSELSVMQVSAPAVFDFANDFVFTPQVFSFLSPEKKGQIFQKLSFRLPHLEILFEHFIVTNAPWFLFFSMFAHPIPSEFGFIGFMDSLDFKNLFICYYGYQMSEWMKSKKSSNPMNPNSDKMSQTTTWTKYFQIT